MNCSICSDEIDGKPFVKLKTDGTAMRLCMFCFTEFERFDRIFFARICSNENKIYVKNFWPMNKTVLKIFRSLFHGNANMEKYLETVLPIANINNRINYGYW